MNLSTAKIFVIFVLATMQPATGCEAMTNEKKCRNPLEAIAEHVRNPETRAEPLPEWIKEEGRIWLEKNRVEFSKPMLPPWVWRPQEPRSSIGWRMGGGESYLDAFDDWVKSMTAAEFQDFTSEHIEPAEWTGYLLGLRGPN